LILQNGVTNSNIVPFHNIIFLAISIACRYSLLCLCICYYLWCICYGYLLLQIRSVDIK